MSRPPPQPGEPLPEISAQMLSALLNVCCDRPAHQGSLLALDSRGLVRIIRDRPQLTGIGRAYLGGYWAALRVAPGVLEAYRAQFAHLGFRVFRDPAAKAGRMEKG